MPDVSGGKRGAPHERNTRDLRVTQVHRPPVFLPRGRQRCCFGRGLEIQHTVF
jgi:hypothetical protein